MLPMGVQSRPRKPKRDLVSTSVSAWANFTPLRLRPYLWFDAADTSTITSSSGAVSQWDDKSGFVRNLTQGTGANQPITGSNQINGLNVINFNGTSHAVSTAAFNVPIAQHVYAVVRPTSFSNAYNSVFSQETNVDGRTLLVKSSGKLAIYESSASGNTSYDGTGNTTLSSNTAYVLEYSWNGFQLFGWVNLSSDATVNKTFTTGTPSTPFRVGHSNFSGRLWQGDIAEIVAFPAPLSTYGQQAMRNYLNAKWAVY